MLKPTTLQSALINAVPELGANPAMLSVWVDKGKNIATLAASLSFEKVFNLNVAIRGYSGDIDTLFVPVMAWLRVNQPDMFTADTAQEARFSWTLTQNADASQDLLMVLQLTERTQVQEVDGALHAETLPEPPEPARVTRPKALYINGELVSRWQE